MLRSILILLVGTLSLFFSCSTREREYKKLQKTYNTEKQKEILQSARDSISRIWNGEELPDVPGPGTNEGVVIRLLVNGMDRGCHAWYRNTGDINQFAAFCAAYALRDYRYKPVRPEEAEDLILELVIFGKWEEIKDAQDFVLGFHNLWLVDGVFNTILQAAVVQQGIFTKEEFLEIICEKALLDKNAWKDNKNLSWRRSPSIIYSEPYQQNKQKSNL